MQLCYRLFVVLTLLTPLQVAGPVVKAVVARIEQANGTISNEKKTIAQMIDEVLEQEFPEQKEEAIGKNYNDTAQNNADVSTTLQALSVPAAGVSSCCRQPVTSAGLCVSCLGCIWSPAVWHHDTATPLQPGSAADCCIPVLCGCSLVVCVAFALQIGST